MTRLALPLLVLTALLPAVPADAAVSWQVVTSRNQFFPAEITVFEGDTAFLTNADLERHDLTALDTGENGQPLFRSATIGPGQRAEVVGVASLTESVYPFFCTVHEWMTGNITVLPAP